MFAPLQYFQIKFTSKGTSSKTKYCREEGEILGDRKGVGTTSKCASTVMKRALLDPAIL